MKIKSRPYKYIFVDKNGNEKEESVWAYFELDADRRAGELASRYASVDYYPVRKENVL